VNDAIAAPIGLLLLHSMKVTGSGSGAGSTGSVVKKVLIGKVPDRGGRPMAEHRAKAIIAKEGRGFGGGGRGGRGGGGRGGGDGRDEKKRKEENAVKDGGGSSLKKGRVVSHG
jgi:hypothetical protein